MPANTHQHPVVKQLVEWRDKAQTNEGRQHYELARNHQATALRMAWLASRNEQIQRQYENSAAMFSAKGQTLLAEQAKAYALKHQGYTLNLRNRAANLLRDAQNALTTAQQHEKIVSEQ
jgi:hypothetical protein